MPVVENASCIPKSFLPEVKETPNLSWAHGCPFMFSASLAAACSYLTKFFPQE